MKQCQKGSLRQRAEQQIKLVRRERVLGRKLPQQDEILEERQKRSSAVPLHQKQARPLPSAVTHHVEVQGFAEVDGLQQQHQPVLHLLGFEQQAAEGLDGATLTQEVHDGEKSHVLLGQVIIRQQTFCT